ncbi:uncharacterized protein LOC117386386 [Periophthalmus magnuspinnatus]|uniref:uncharacterized protein LOC117386386 n=1 Tax=Periophthalmus magnuspinnatus TaxID=409849 RepID=UPI0024367EF4|nr:uncharacterized protein LOC117386386 [Periophthalmus magnuspinnatus]
MNGLYSKHAQQRRLRSVPRHYRPRSREARLCHVIRAEASTSASRIIPKTSNTRSRRTDPSGPERTRAMSLWSARLLLLLFYVHRAALGQETVDVTTDKPSVFLRASSRPLVSAPSVLWTRGPNEEVHQRVSEGDDTRAQSSLFRGRTQMRSDALQTGDLTLELKSPGLNDSGVYTCVAKEGTREVARATVELRVKEPPPSPSPADITGIIVGVVLGSAALLVGVLSALTVKRKKQTKENFKDSLIGLVTCRPAAVL